MTASAREVRKTVTILFCDLVHSTGLAEGADPETYRRVQSRYFDEMRGVIERHGGTVEKFIGDEVMAVFGVPAVHEDDALRAVRAAREMLDRLEALNEELEPAWGVRLQARIGVNTGEVVAGDAAQGASFVAGEPVIVAKRLEQAAGAGEILIGKATFPLVEHAVTAGPLERIPVKGKREDVGRRRIDKVDRAGPSLARRLDVPIVGRGEELRLLHQAFDQAVESRSCRLFTVLGPAGIGKSRLAAELASSLDGRATTTAGRCLPYGEGITFWPLTEILESIGDEDALRQALGDTEERDVVLELLSGATGASEVGGTSQETFWAVRQAFEALARERPLVVCFEDLHWAEPTLLDLVEYVVGWSRDAPILVLCVARPELVERRPTLIAPQVNADALVLQPLSHEETETLLVHLGTELPAPIRERIGAAAEGNPLYVEQMAAMAVERNGEGLAIPPSIHALLVERLDRLSGAERAVVETASVIGRDFSMPAVASLSREDQREALSSHLLSLVRKGFVRPDPGRPEPEDRFSFNHVLIRDTAYEAMPKELRAKLHERLADWVQGGLAHGGEYEEILAYHLEQAYRLRAEVGLRGEAEARLAIRAGRALAAAGKRAAARDDTPAARSLLGRAVSLLPDDDPERTTVLLELGSGLMRAGPFAEAEPVLTEAMESARRAGDRALELRAQIELTFLREFTKPEGAIEEILEVGTSAVPELEQLGDQIGLAKAWHLLSEPHLIACRWGARAEALERALQHAERAGDRRLRAALIGYLVQALLFGPTPVAQAIERCEDFLRSAPGDRTVEAGVLSSLGTLHAMRGEFDVGRRTLERGLAIYDELGLRFRRAGRTLLTASVELLAGDPAAAVQALRDGYETLEAMGERGVRSTLAAYLADALCAAGDYEEAERLSRISEEAAGSDDLVTQVVWRRARAKAVARRGKLDEAETLVSEANRLASQADFPDLQASTLTSLAEVLRLARRDDEAILCLRQAREIYERKGNLVAAGLSLPSP